MKDSIWQRLMLYGLEYFGLYYSTYRGFVVDNDDPKKLNQIKVILPSLNPSDNVGTWAYPKNHWGGKDYGTNLLPVKGDMVFIEFDHGNLSYPIWSHAGYGLEEKPEEFEKPSDYGFKTPNKNLIIIKDGINTDDGKILVLFKTGNEYFLIEKGKYELEAPLIKLGKNGDEWALKGQTTLEKIDFLIDAVKDLNDKITNHTHQTGAPFSVTSAPVNSIAFIENKADLVYLENNLDEILSTKVKIDG